MLKEGTAALKHLCEINGNLEQSCHLKKQTEKVQNLKLWHQKPFG